MEVLKLRIINKSQLKHLVNEFPDGGVVFTEYDPEYFTSEFMVTESPFSVKEVIPWNNEVQKYEWDIDIYDDSAQFAVFSNDDVLQMIQTLTAGLRIDLGDSVYML